jgi:hypothetical protein
MRADADDHVRSRGPEPGGHAYGDHAEGRGLAAVVGQEPGESAHEGAAEGDDGGVKGDNITGHRRQGVSKEDAGLSTQRDNKMGSRKPVYLLSSIFVPKLTLCETDLTQTLFAASSNQQCASRRRSTPIKYMHRTGNEIRRVQHQRDRKGAALVEVALRFPGFGPSSLGEL